MSAYAIYKELFPPQTVEQVETCHFTCPEAINLVVAKASLLQIYAFVEYLPEQKPKEDNDDEDSLGDQELANERLNENEDVSLVFPKLKPLQQKKDVAGSSLGRLELVAQYKLNGTIATMGVVRTNSSRGKEGCDSLLLGFSDAKMSLLEWSPATNAIVTVSIHYYERDEYKKEFLNNPYPSNIHIDPQQRCAVLNFYDNKLAVLPFRQADKLGERQDDVEEDEEAQKWPYLPSFLIDLETIDSRIQNVIDMVFLSDYYEPTLAILFQSEQTWTGRLGSVKDTVSVVVISLDLTAKIYPIIYSIDKLPYDCLKLVAMPKPVTGVLVIAANSLLHVSQGSPGVGVAVNGYAKKITEFPGMIYDDKLIQLGLALDGAKALAYGRDRCLIFMQNGHWAIVQMKLDGSKVVGMQIQEIVNPTGQTYATVPSCVTHVKPNEYFFLGSRVGDSLLIKWNHLPTFRVCDTLLNTGPILDMSMGDVESNQNTEQKVQGIPDLELVSCSGHGQNGALSVFQRHIHPQTSFSFTQSDSQAIWSIKCRKELLDRRSSVGSEDNARWEDDHAFDEALDKLLFISKSKSTMVLSAGDELQELVKTGFYTRGPTIAVSTLFDATRIVQVYATGVMILTPKGKRLRTIPMRGSKIVDASIRDPYILLTLDNNKIVVLRGDEQQKEVSPISLPSHVHKMPISMASIFADTSGLFTTVADKKKKRKATTEIPQTNPKRHMHEFDEVDMDLYGDQLDHEIKNTPAPISVFGEDMDDDDEMLYGNQATTTTQVDETNVSLQGNLNEMTRVSFWAVLHTHDGTLYIYSLPDFKEHFVCSQFDILPELITDHKDKKKPSQPRSVIKELLLTNIGKERKDPHLVARTDSNDIIIYKAFSFVPSDSSDRLALRFSRVHHEYVSHKPEKQAAKRKEIIDEFEIPGLDLDDEEEQPKLDKHHKKRLIPFSDVAGYTGVFVAGVQPAWLMNSCKSFVRVHPMKTEHPVIGFTQFHNVNCQHGFITVDEKSNVRLSKLRTDNVIYDLDWVLQKIPLGRTPHKIEYHPFMRVYAVVVSSAQPARVHIEEETAEGQVPEKEENTSEFLPQVDKFSMIMVSPVTWEIVDTVVFEEFEQCFSLECAALESKQTSTGRKHFMVVGTGYLKGEDTTMRGSIRIYDIIEVVPEPNNPQTNHKFKHLHTEDVKGAVTAMCNVSGHLASCIGSKVIVWSLEDDESLVGVAFIDVQIYVTSMSSIKNFILLGDAQKSIWFLGFQLEPAKLSLLGKDYQSFEVGCVDFIIDDKSLYLVVGDTNENLDLYQYAPFNLQSFGGQKLMRRGDFHVGSQVQTMVRLPQIEKTDKGFEYTRRHFCLCGTFSGSISVISPISEKTFKRLSTLYGQLVNNVQHVAGLNPRAYRLIKGPKQRMASNRTKAILDGDLIFEFAGLSIEQQKEITKQIGTTVARIKEDLVDIETSIDHF
ncbi:CPSF A subunit region-domain-containing protein [Gilbertella persicaria]|uniref:CPSF A subunit region-domain-containing protein n=1 Tax=Gilbertella persicaria TaxID=101096 RepID=UPI0022201BEC|nr:CPSF A subunit region-domain-containing protein [Gilbertella persicaria]KAI8067717.1 CPSF A subunit region-domain-containing protein [Gilbertella persicaria]